MKNELHASANFLFEVGMLDQTPRSGYHFLGGAKQSVAAHTNRVCFGAYVLAKLHGGADVGKAVQMALFHDFAEARVSDLNYVHQRYVQRDEHQAIADATQRLPFGEDVRMMVAEYEARESIEAQLVKDADNLEMVLFLKEQIDLGNHRAKTWMGFTVQRLKTDIAKQLAEEILETASDEWWFDSGKSNWWVDRLKKHEVVGNTRS